MPFVKFHNPKTSRCPSAKCTTQSTSPEFEIAVIDPKGGNPMHVLQCAYCGGVICVLPKEVSLA